MPNHRAPAMGVPAVRRCSVSSAAANAPCGGVDRWIDRWLYYSCHRWMQQGGVVIMHPSHANPPRVQNAANSKHASAPTGTPRAPPAYSARAAGLSPGMSPLIQSGLAWPKRGRAWSLAHSRSGLLKYTSTGREPLGWVRLGRANWCGGAHVGGWLSGRSGGCGRVRLGGTQPRVRRRWARPTWRGVRPKGHAV